MEEPKPDYVVGQGMVCNLEHAADGGRRVPPGNLSSSTSSSSEQLQPRGRFRKGAWRQSHQLPQHLATLQCAWANGLYEKWIDRVDDPAWPDKLEGVLQNYINAQGGLHGAHIGDDCTQEVERVLRAHMAKFTQFSNPRAESGFTGPPV